MIDVVKRTNLIVFFIPPEKKVNGGIMSIFSQCKEARRFQKIHNAETVLCTYPGDETYGKNDLFENSEKIYSFDQIIEKWENPDRLMLHVPETGVRMINESFRNDKYKNYLKDAGDLHINVMNQNIELMREPVEFAELFRLTPKITQTTAHIRYTTQALSNKYQTPVHHLSVFIDPGQYKYMPYKEKENLIIYSPDESPAKNKIIDSINSLEGYETQEIVNIPYEEYKRLAAKAKFCITFGEGFDGYFIESFFSGSIGIAVYNDGFFPDESFLDLPTVFDSYDSMATNMVGIIKSLDNEQGFKALTEEGQKKIGKLYSQTTYLKKMENFYKANYDFVPEPGSASELIEKLVAEQDSLNDRLMEAKKRLGQEQQTTQRLKTDILNLLNSRSWKITKPLRKVKKHKK